MNAPTPTQVRMAVLARLGKGPAEAVHLTGYCVDQGWPFDHLRDAVPQAVGDLISEGKVEAWDVPSQYAKRCTYKVFRLTGSTPMESSNEPSGDSGELPPGHISAADFRKSGRKSP